MTSLHWRSCEYLRSVVWWMVAVEISHRIDY